MNTKRFLAAALLAFAGIAAQPAPTRAHDGGDRWELPGNAVFPEGIAIQANSGRFFVGSTTDGTIFAGNLENPGPASVFLPGGADGRTFAVGMKATRSRLYVSGGPTGMVFVYDTNTKALLAKFSGGLSPTFINDVTVLPNGDAYFTDSQSSALYRLSADLATFERYTDFAGTEFTPAPGFNLNGIAHTRDGQYLILMQSNLGKIYRTNVATKETRAIATNGAVLNGGDGILMVGGRMLYVLRNAAALLVGLKLSDDYLSAELVSVTTDAGFQFPTTFGKYEDDFLVVNSQFNRRGTPAGPVLPFNVSSLEIPEAGDGLRLEATLTGAAETAGGDTDGSGSARIKIKPNQGEVCFDVRVADITLPASGMHIHAAAAGANGPIVVDPNMPPGADGRSNVCTPVAATLLNAIWSNPAGYYVNVHNSDFPRGAVRGQLMQRMHD